MALSLMSTARTTKQRVKRKLKKNGSVSGKRREKCFFFGIFFLFFFIWSKDKEEGMKWSETSAQ
jgi:hypothetical protein